MKKTATKKQPTVRTISPAKDEFPRELLKQSTEARLSYFKQQLFRHPILDEMFEKLIDAIREPGDRRTINLYGPTGVGKTTLCYLAVQQIMELLPILQQQRMCSPILRLDALASEARRFGWKDFYKLWLIALNQQYPEVGIDFGIAGIRRDAQGRLIIDDRVNVHSLRRAATAFTRKVNPLATVVDEAPHMKKLASGERVAHQMDVIKSLTDETKSVIVLVGTYELLDMTNLNGQQGRRSRDIHLRRYQFDEKDRKSFENVLRTLQCHLPLAEMPDLISMAEYLYKGCLGCIGILKTWLDETLGAVLKVNKSTMTRRDLEKHELEKGKKVQIAKEIWEGEEKLRSLERECDADLDKYLGLVSS